MSLPTSAERRKSIPLYRGVLKYFPDALCAVAECSQAGNDQHHPDTPIHWDKSKSTDEGDALLRHLVDAGTLDTDGIRHSAKVAWRALALLQREIDAEAAPHPIGFPSKVDAAKDQRDYFMGLLDREEKGLPLTREELIALQSRDEV